MFIYRNYIAHIIPSFLLKIKLVKFVKVNKNVSVSRRFICINFLSVYKNAQWKLFTISIVYTEISNAPLYRNLILQY